MIKILHIAICLGFITMGGSCATDAPVVDETVDVDIPAVETDSTGSLVSLPDEPAQVVGPQCGAVVCPAGTRCCNPTCGACVPPGVECTQEVCSRD
jgi:hypothetical protein